jgi:hypothetical protein
MQVARFYVKNTDVAFDQPIPEGATLANLMQAVRNDGFVLGLGFFIPLSEIHFVAEYTAETVQQGAKVVPFVVVQPDKPAP